MTAKTKQPVARPGSPTSVLDLSHGDLKKLFAPSPENAVSHYTTYNRLQAKDLLRQLHDARRAEKKRSASPPPHLKAIESVEDDDDDAASSSRREPTLREPTLRQNLHRAALWPKFMLLNCFSAMFEAVWIMLRDLW